MGRCRAEASCSQGPRLDTLFSSRAQLCVVFTLSPVHHCFAPSASSAFLVLHVRRYTDPFLLRHRTFLPFLSRCDPTMQTDLFTPQRHEVRESISAVRDASTLAWSASAPTAVQAGTARPGLLWCLVHGTLPRVIRYALLVFGHTRAHSALNTPTGRSAFSSRALALVLFTTASPKAVASLEYDPRHLVRRGAAQAAERLTVVSPGLSWASPSSLR